MSAPSVSGNQPWLFVSIMFPGPRRNRICVSPGRPSAPEVRSPPPGLPHLFLLSVPVGLPGLPHRYLPLDPVDLHFPSDRSLPALPCRLSAPEGLPDQHHLPAPFHRLPLPGRCRHALLYLPSAPEDPRDPVPPLAREAPPRSGFGLRLLPPLSCFVPLTVRFLLTPGLFLLRSLHPRLHYRLHFLPSFLTIQLLLHFVMTHWLFERPQEAEDEDASSDCFAEAALSAACRADSDASPAEVSAFAALSSA